MNSSIRTRVISVVGFIAILLGCALWANAKESNQARPITYIVFSARLQGCFTDYPPNIVKPICEVIVSGVTNLAPNSVLLVEIQDYIGQGSTAFNDGDTVIVGPTGEFTIAVRAESGLRMRANLICSVLFIPAWGQPTNIVRKYGKDGKGLSGPQLSGNHGGLLLDAISVVRE